jgi:hypothetical protein
LDTDESSDTDFGQQNDALYLDAGDESSVGDNSVMIIFCGRKWTIKSDNKKPLVELVNIKTVLRVLLML